MKKYKICLETRGGKAVNTPIINAHDEREAVIKYLNSIDEKISEEKINLYIVSTYEHIPQPRKKEEIKLREQADVNKLQQICEEVVDIEEGLMYGTIDFKYDNLMSAMKPGHPMEILDSLLANIYFDIISGKEPPMEKIEETVENFKEFKKVFDVKELSKPIKELSNYIKERKLYIKG